MSCGLVRARLAAKRDQLRHRHRLSKFLLRHGCRPPTGATPWTQKYLEWVRTDLHFSTPAQDAVRLDYLHEVERAGERIARLGQAIDAAVATAPAAMRAVIAALQALRGIAKVSAVTIVAELGQPCASRARRSSWATAVWWRASTRAGRRCGGGRSPRRAHPVFGTLRALGCPIKLDGVSPRYTPAAALGAHTGVLLGEVGVGADELARLRAAGVV